MTPRANWKGFLKLSLVTCSIAVFPAISASQKIRFNIINRKTGNRVHNEVVDAETGEEVPDQDRVKGFKTRDGSYVLVEDDELDEVALDSTHTIDIEKFVPRDEIDKLYLAEPYYIVPDGEIAVEAFAVIREAMRAKKVVGLARLVLHRREHILMLSPRGKGLMGTILRYCSEVRDEAAYFDDIPDVRVADDMLDLARHIVAGKLGHFEPGEYDDRYEKALADLIRAKQSGKTPPSAPSPSPGNVVNLMDALRRSVQGERGRSSARGTARKSSGRAASGSRRRRLKKAS